MTDIEFEKVKEQEGMGLVDINTTAAREQVGEIEQGIEYLKERPRCVVSTLYPVGVQCVPKPMVVCLVNNVTTCVNAVPGSLGVSDKYSPRKIVTQRTFDFARDYKVQFGAYEEASDGAIVTNTTKLRTRGWIKLSYA